MREFLHKDMKKKLIWSVIIGITAAVLLQGPEPAAKAPVKSWWGSLYPQYCFSEIPRDESGEPARVRFTFRWLHGI